MTTRCAAAGVFSLLLLPFRSSTAAKPNILHILLDDFGWADAGWHRPPHYQDVQSVNMNALLKEGVELDRHYVFMFCSPTRSAIQSGRNPIHVNTVNTSPQLRNPTWDPQYLPPEITGQNGEDPVSLKNIFAGGGTMRSMEGSPGMDAG